MDTTSTNPLIGFASLDIMNKFDAIRATITKLRGDAESAKLNALEEFSFDKPRVDILCAQGNTAEAYIREMLGNIAGLQQV